MLASWAMAIAPLTATCGTLIEADADWSTLDAIPDELVRDQLGSSGVLVLRGFAVTPRDLDVVARRFSKELMPGVGRAVFPELRLIHLVNETFDALEPHTDNGTRPEAFRPDITWMLCEQPSDTGGETTLFDGVEVWRQLSLETRERLRSTRLSFITRYAAIAWRAMGFANLDAFRQFASSIGASTRLLDGSAVEVEVSCSAHRVTKYGGHDAFVSSMLVAGAKGFDQMVVRFEDASPLPDALHAEIKAAVTSSCEEVALRSGDLAVFDNTRIMHGRRAYTDPRRRLYLLQTRTANF